MTNLKNELHNLMCIVYHHLFQNANYPVYILQNDEHLMQLLNGKIQEIKGVAATETLTSLDQRIKRTIPIE